MSYLTLTDYASSPSLLVAGVAKILQKDSPFMSKMAFETVAALAVKVIREGKMPTPAWRKIGNPHGSTKGTRPDQVEENAFSFGNMIDVDKAYMKDQSPKFYDPRTYWTDMTVKAMGREFTDATINGDPTVNEDRPTGLFYRVKNHLAASQRLTADPLGGSAGLDVSMDAASLSSNIQILLDKLDLLIYSCAENRADMLLMNDTMINRIWSVLRQSGLLKSTTDNLGREWYEYKGATFVDMGFKIDDETRVIGNAETLDGTALTAGTGTSIYALRTGKEFFTTWQEYPMEVEDKGYLDDAVTYRVVVDWVIGLALSHPRSVSRLYGIVAA